MIFLRIKSPIYYYNTNIYGGFPAYFRFSYYSLLLVNARIYRLHWPHHVQCTVLEFGVWTDSLGVDDWWLFNWHLNMLKSSNEWNNSKNSRFHSLKNRNDGLSINTFKYGTCVIKPTWHFQCFHFLLKGNQCRIYVVKIIPMTLYAISYTRNS